MIRYEVNPPKLAQDAGGAVERTVGRIKEISGYCRAVHITENVLGRRRISPLEIARRVSKEAPDLEITVSMRVRDRDPGQIDRFVQECSESGVSGILAVMGDPRSDGGSDSGQTPSRAVPRLRAAGAKAYLSMPAEPKDSTLGAKSAARPDGFMTQVVSSPSQVRRLCARLPGFEVIPIAMFPSPKNEPSARMLGIDTSHDFAELVSEAQNAAGDVLITSPSDYAGLLRFLSRG